MTPDQARVLAVHVVRCWPHEAVDAWYGTLLPLDHTTAVNTVERCRARYTGPLLPAATFRSEYGPTWPDPTNAGPCTACASTGVLDVDDAGVEEHCSCEHGLRRATAVPPPTLIDDRFRLSTSEREHGLAQVAKLRAQIAELRR